MPNATTKPVKFLFKLAPEQRIALHRIAEERGVNAADVMRDAVADLTGVPNTVKTKSRLRSHPRRDRDENGRSPHDERPPAKTTPRTNTNA